MAATDTARRSRKTGDGPDVIRHSIELLVEGLRLNLTVFGNRATASRISRIIFAMIMAVQEKPALQRNALVDTVRHDHGVIGDSR
jgi:hypothetical protein